MLGSKEEPYPGRVLFKTYIFLRFRILADISVLLISAIIKIW